jgi:hypothetical protein
MFLLTGNANLLVKTLSVLSHSPSSHDRDFATDFVHKIGHTTTKARG